MHGKNQTLKTVKVSEENVDPRFLPFHNAVIALEILGLAAKADVIIQIQKIRPSCNVLAMDADLLVQ